MDKSNGYEAHAADFMRGRNPHVGTEVVRAWARELPAGAAVLELGCGHGLISAVLAEAGMALYAVDASPTLLNAFRARLPAMATECAAAEESSFFNRHFDGVVAWGLIFLLEEEAQRIVLHKVADVLKPGGRLLFTAPREAVVWMDAMTGLESRSLGGAAYEELLREAGLEVLPGCLDAGENYYYFAVKR